MPLWETSSQTIRNVLGVCTQFIDHVALATLNNIYTESGMICDPLH